MATALSRIGWDCQIIDSRPITAAPNDLRTIAIMMNGIAILKEWGLWPILAPDAAPLRELWLEDDSLGWPLRQGFAAGDIGTEAFGYNIPAAQLRAALLTSLQANDRVTLTGEKKIVGIDSNHRQATLTLDSGEVLHTPLVIAIEGAHSPLREYLKIPTKFFAVNQMAMVCQISHDRPHHDVSTEFHGKNGQVTLIPMPGQHSAVNIVGTEAMISRLHHLSPDELRAAIQDLTRDALGHITAVSPPRLYPVRPFRVSQWVKGRCVLAGEAAHVMPPIGAQGLNISMGDIACLTDLLGPATPNKDPGQASTLRHYQRRRQLDLAARCAATGALARAVHGWMPGLDPLRRVGLLAAGQVGPLRRALMRFGMAAA